MTIQIWSDVDVDVQSAAAAAKPITAISKATQAVVTAAAHGLVVGDLALLRVRGLGQIDWALVRAAAPLTTDSFVARGVDTSEFTGTFVSGSVSKITLGISSETITDVSPSGGDAAQVTISTIHKKPDYAITGKSAPLTYALGSLWDVSDPALLAFKAASRAKKVLAVRFGFPDGTEVLFAAQPSANLAPGGSAGAAVTTPVTLAVRGWLQAYEPTV
jgi:hypothetical protein